jgi:heterodisulfide reductase subunit C2
MSNHHHHENNTLSGELLKHTGVNAARCYQCGKCSAGCPLSEDMDYPPSVIMHLLQSNREEYDEKVLRSHTIWLCLACEMCYGRCPMEIDIPKVMDYCREKSYKLKKTNPKAKYIIAFHKAFLDSIEKTGRLYEVGLIADYKMRSMHLTQDVMVAPKMFTRGVLPLIPELIKGRKGIAKIFNKTIKKKEGEK